MLLAKLMLRAVGSVVLSILIAAAAHADGLVRELRIGGLVHDMPGMWSGFTYETHTIDVNLEALLASGLPVLGGVLRPAVGGTINTRGDTSHAYVDARWEIELPYRLFAGVGLGAAVHNGHIGPDSPTAKAFGSRVLFHVPAEIGIRLDQHNSLSVYFEHTSNADIASLNEGMDRLGVRYGYRF